MRESECAPGAFDRDWILASTVLTVILGFFALALMIVLPFTALPDPVFSLASWFGWSFMASGVAVLVYTVKLMRTGEQRPIKRLAENCRTDRRRYAIIAFGMILAGADMYFFMIIKPELNLLFPFWTDPALANIDAYLLGRDAWHLFAEWNLEVLAWVYTPCWFFGILLTFYWLLLKSPSMIKSTAIVSYFAIWSIFGPVGQALFSSAGPIFYSRLGLGDRFAEMPIPPLPGTLSDYLWHAFEHQSLVPGAGISAMPSLHIATMAWMVLAFFSFRSRWTIPALVLSLYIYAGSVALGWHYMMDGLVGMAGAAVCFRLSRAYVQSMNALRAGPVPSSSLQ
jgi:hypothetical protein